MQQRNKKGKENSVHCQRECKFVIYINYVNWYIHYEKHAGSLKILAIPLLGIYPKEMKTVTEKGICIPMFTYSIIYNSQDTGISDRWMKKMWCVYIHTHIYIYVLCTYIHIYVHTHVYIYMHIYIPDGILLSLNKTEILSFTTT